MCRCGAVSLPVYSVMSISWPCCHSPVAPGFLPIVSGWFQLLRAPTLSKAPVMILVHPCVIFQQPGFSVSWILLCLSHSLFRVGLFVWLGFLALLFFCFLHSLEFLKTNHFNPPQSQLQATRSSHPLLIFCFAHPSTLTPPKFFCPPHP